MIQAIGEETPPAYREYSKKHDAMVHELKVLEAERKEVKATIDGYTGDRQYRCPALVTAKTRNVVLKDKIYRLRKLLGIPTKHK